MLKTRFIKCLLLLLVFTLFIPAFVFAASKKEGGSAEEGAEEYEMILIPKLRSPWFNFMEEGLLKAAEDFGVKAYMQAPASPDEAIQVRMVEDAISKGVDAILVIPNDAKSLEPVFAKAQSKGIIVATHESPQQGNADFDVEMIDNIKFGEHGMKKLIEAMGTENADFAIYVGSLTVPLHNIWADAAIDLVEREYPGLNLVTTRIPAAEDQSLSRQKALELLKSYPNLRGFLCFGSQGGPGAAQAVREKGLNDIVQVSGTTTPNQARQYLDDGSFDYSFIWSPADAAYSLVYVAKALLDGKSLSDIKEIPTVGTPELEGNTFKFNKPMGITKENSRDYDF